MGKTPLTAPDVLKSLPIGLSVNREQAAMLLRGLDALTEDDKRGIIYKALRRDLESIVVIWDRRVKNEKIVQEMNKKK
jgi:hypothetical protein